MAMRYYFVPKIGTGGQGDAYRPKYFTESAPGAADPLHAGGWTAMDYGIHPTFLVAADVDAATHTAIAANGDVVAVPQDLSNTVGGNLTAVQNALDSLDIPSDWITSGMTYRVVLRWVARLFQIAQRLNGMHRQRLLPAGITLNSLVSDMTVNQRTKMAEAAQSFGLDTSGITGGMTVRNALKLLGDQMTLPIFHGGQEL